MDIHTHRLMSMFSEYVEFRYNTTSVMAGVGIVNKQNQHIDSSHMNSTKVV